MQKLMITLIAALALICAGCAEKKADDHAGHDHGDKKECCGTCGGVKKAACDCGKADCEKCKAAKAACDCGKADCEKCKAASTDKAGTEEPTAE